LMETVKRALIRRACSAIKMRVMQQWHGRCARTSLLINRYQKFKRAQSVECVLREWAGVTSNSTRISTQADRQVMAVHGRAVQQCFGQWTQHTRRQRLLAQCALLDSIRAPRLGLIVLCKHRCFRALKRLTRLARAVDAMLLRIQLCVSRGLLTHSFWSWSRSTSDAKFLDQQNALGAAHILRALVDKRGERIERSPTITGASTATAAGATVPLASLCRWENDTQVCVCVCKCVCVCVCATSYMYRDSKS
jgi:hypothetical protein